MSIGTIVGGLLHLTCSVANGIKANRWRSADALATQKLEAAREETVTKRVVME